MFRERKKILVFLFVNLVLIFVGGCISEDNLKSEDELNNNQTVNENPITIKNLTSWGDSHKINDTIMIGDKIFALTDSFIQILTVDNNATVTEVSKIDFGGTRLKTDGNNIFVVNNDKIIILDSTTGTKVSEYTISSSEAYGNGYIGSNPTIVDIEVNENYVYGLKLMDNGAQPYFFKIDIIDLDDITKISAYYIGSQAQWSKVDDLIVEDEFAFVLDSYDMGLASYPKNGLSDDERISLEMSAASLSGGESPQMTKYGNIIIVATINPIRFFNVSSSGELSFAKNYSLFDSYINITKIANNKNIVAISSDEKGLKVIDISDLQNITEIFEDSTIKNVNSLYMSDEFLFVSTNGGMKIYSM